MAPSLRDDAGLVFFRLRHRPFQAGERPATSHAAGDAVLTQLSGRLGQRLPGHRLPGALGRARNFASWRVPRRARTAPNWPSGCAPRSPMRHASSNDGRRLSRTCSIGFCCLPLSAQHPDALDWSAVVKYCRCGTLRRQERRPQWLAGSAQRPWRVGRCLARPVAPTAGRMVALGRAPTGLVTRAQRHGGGRHAELGALRAAENSATGVLT